MVDGKVQKKSKNLLVPDFADRALLKTLKGGV